ncbi:hypothetical protein [Cellvibrio sp. QJXJ]|uniref:hypothetical protein n=1 Tax=Cellvibrio sp. QJXJ TaxID=2964606 RepID=UPI0021C3183F|nr:hypothetical protein [Cellvibrio sp. QJXJ]UUA75275.1 hypothetical protein NNX04_22730 [Cellvibrio sp. QJXJ]
MAITKNTKIIHPVTGVHEFGAIPEIIKPEKKLHIEGGNIYLKHGEHIAKNRGFGVNHIWIEHSDQLIKLGYSTIDDVPRYVSEIIVAGASIHVADYRRPTVLRSAKGIVILELKLVGNSCEYSVVTAYPQKYAHGSIVGNI